MASSSFSDRLRAGWSREHLMEYYCLTPQQFEKIIADLKRLKVSKEVT